MFFAVSHLIFGWAPLESEPAESVQKSEGACSLTPPTRNLIGHKPDVTVRGRVPMRLRNRLAIATLLLCSVAAGTAQANTITIRDGDGPDSGTLTTTGSFSGYVAQGCTDSSCSPRAADGDGPFVLS